MKKVTTHILNVANYQYFSVDFPDIVEKGAWPPKVGDIC